MDKWMRRRWERAKQLAAAGKVQGGPCGFRVESGRVSGLEYDVVVNFQAGQLRSCSCTCPDFQASWRLALNLYARQDNIPRLHGVIVCKHVLAAGLTKVHECGTMEVK